MLLYYGVTPLLLTPHFAIYFQLYTLGTETFASQKIREILHKLLRIGQNIIFLVLNFHEWTEKLIFLLLFLGNVWIQREIKERKLSFFQLLYHALFSVSNSYINQSPVKIKKIEQRYINASFLTNLLRISMLFFTKTFVKNLC